MTTNREIERPQITCSRNRSVERSTDDVALTWSWHSITGGISVLMIGFVFALLFVLTASVCDAFQPNIDEAAAGFASAALPPTQIAAPASQTDGVLQELRDNLNVWGYTQNTTGVFYNTEGTKWWIHHHLNSLATERQQTEIDINESFGEHLAFFARFWGVYEPSYPFENDARVGAKNLSDFYNNYGFRDLFLTIKEGALTLDVGSRYISWGTSLVFLVANQINPQDLSWGFGFANLEQSHRPIYMVHPIYNLPRVGPFSSFLEMVYAPGFDFLYNHVDYPDDRFEGQNSVAGRVNALPVIGSSRFGGGKDNRCRPGESVCGLPGGIAVQPPFSYVLDGGQQLNLQWAVPRATWANSQLGFRFDTVIDDGPEASIFYWRSFDYTPQLYVGPAGAPNTFRRLTERFPHYESLGATTQWMLPAVLANSLPLKMRAEFFYKNHEAFSTSARSVTSGIVNSDTLNTLLGVDLFRLPVRWLTTAATLNATLECQEITILDASDKMLQAQGVLTKVHKHEVNALANVYTSWTWDKYFITPAMGATYNPDGTTFFLLPQILLQPAKLHPEFNIRIGSTVILGNDKYAFSALGSLKGSSNIFAQFQYNFSVLSGDAK